MRYGARSHAVRTAAGLAIAVVLAASAAEAQSCPKGPLRLYTSWSLQGDMAGEGNGMIVQRGFRQPPSYHDERLRSAPVGYFFDVMTNGFGAMQDYSAQVTVPDRWAIAAYIRVLQLSRSATVNDVPADRRGDLDRPADIPAPPAQENRQP